MKTLCCFLAAAVALVSSQAWAQCSSCAGSSPMFQGASNYAPVTYSSGAYYANNYSYAPMASHPMGGYSNCCATSYGGMNCCQTNYRRGFRRSHRTVCHPVCHHGCSTSCNYNVCGSVNCCNGMAYHQPHWHGHYQPVQTYTSQMYASPCCGGQLVMGAGCGGMPQGSNTSTVPMHGNYVPGTQPPATSNQPSTNSSLIEAPGNETTPPTPDTSEPPRTPESSESQPANPDDET